MAENPLGTLARLLAGVALVQGRLGHQVLGQLLIAGSNDAAVAAAAVVIAGTTRTRNAVAQVALRTAAPAIAVHALLQGEERRINRLGESLRERQKRVAAEQVQARGGAVHAEEAESLPDGESGNSRTREGRPRGRQGTRRE